MADRAVIFDMDGTLSDCSHRRHLVAGKKKDWSGFHHRMGDDPPHQPVCALAGALADAGYQILVVTGRDEGYREQTELWLTFNGVPWAELHMRPKGDHRDDTEIKREILGKLRPRFDIHMAVDDRDRLVKMWREEGLTCFQCAEGDPRKVAAGRARSNALSAEERSAIARRAALSRHGRELPKAVAEGTLKIGDMELPCAVLGDADNTRLFTQEGFLQAIGRAKKAKGGEGASVDGKPAFLRAKNLEPFISNELLESTTPVEFIPYKGPGYQGRAFGYRAKLLPQVCWVFQDALVARRLLPSQAHIGEACRFLLKALTDHAIEDLVDQATGFEDQKKLDAIYQSISKHVRQDALAWVRMFDIEFYRHIYRLNRWKFDPENTARPGVVGHWTNDIYDRLAPGVRGALHARVRRNTSGRPTQKLTQFLTPEAGRPRLKELLEGVKALMRISTDWPDFQIKLDIAFPRFEDTFALPFDGGLPRLQKPS